MSEQINVEHAFNPEARQAQADLNAYTETRPYEDAAGRLQGEKGFINAEKHFDGLREAHEAETMPEAYENMSVTDVAKALAKSEYDADKTKVEDLSDVLVEKLSAMEDDAVSERDAEHNGDRSDNMWDRVMNVKDKELARLQGEESSQSKGKATPSENKQDIDTDPKEAAESGSSEAASEADKVDANREKLNNLIDEAAQLINSSGKAGDRERFNKIDDEIKQILMEQYGTNDPDDPRIKDALEHLNKQLEEKIQMPESDKKPVSGKGGLRPVREGEFEEGKENPPAGVMAIEPWTLDDYGKKDDDAEQQTPVEEPPVDEPPVEEPPVDEPPVDPPTAEQPPVLLPPSPERPDRVRQPGKVKKWLGRGALALLAFAGGYTAGRGHENYIVKSHDTPSVDNINKFEDHTRDVDEDVQENMVRNYDSAEQFFKNISTKTGAKNFEKMQKRFDKEVKHYMVSEKMSKSSAEALVRAEMEQYFAHLDAQAARK